LFPARPRRSVPIAPSPALAPPPRRAAPPGTAQARSPRVQRLFRRYARFGDLAARDELVERFLPLARGLARRYHRGTEPLDDLVQVASIGLLGAIDRFDPERGREFTTFAVPTIVGVLKRHYRDHGWAMKVQRGDKERVLTLVRATEELSARSGHAPTPIELAEHTGISLEAVLDALELAASARPSSLDGPAGGADGEPGPLGASLGGEDPELALVESRDVVASSVQTLTPRERQVLYLRFVEDRTQTEIGEAIGVTQMQVSRILRHSLERSRAYAEATAARTGTG
jgi:RNA polymerase sigma-B factor